MLDEFHDRDYQAAREALNAEIVRGFSKLAGAVSNAFAVLNRIEYSAPWTSGRKRVRSH